jgi:hypothetical protein
MGGWWSLPANSLTRVLVLTIRSAELLLRHKSRARQTTIIIETVSIQKLVSVACSQFHLPNKGAGQTMSIKMVQMLKMLRCPFASQQYVLDY